MNSKRTHQQALEYVLEKAEQHPVFNPRITADIMRDDFTSAERAGGDEANWSEIAAVCRLALDLPAPE